jgi:hypothetical protein
VHGRSTRSLDRMISITERAKQYLNDHPRADGTVHMLHVHWDRGISDNRRAASGGENEWSHTGPRGWCLEVFGHRLEKGVDDLELVAPGVYAEAISIGGPQFPGGVVDVEGDKLVFKAHAV